MLKGVSVYLIGMMGAGKTTVGRLLAEKLGYRFFDTDEVIVKLAGKSINEIFAEEGQESFRDLESQVLAELSAYKMLSVATGGGIVMRQMNWSYLQHGIVVWLDVPPTQLYDRLRDDTTRPLLKDTDPLAKLESILEQRKAFYAGADVRIGVEPDLTPEEIVPRVLDGIQKSLRPSPMDELLN
ncbi:MAG: shikimate kinase [Cyanobacteriota bacterium]|nr:shikimate kinase [Cyanobacteriota bacterium]